MDSYQIGDDVARIIKAFYREDEVLASKFVADYLLAMERVGDGTHGVTLEQFLAVLPTSLNVPNWITQEESDALVSYLRETVEDHAGKLFR